MGSRAARPGPVGVVGSSTGTRTAAREKTDGGDGSAIWPGGSLMVRLPSSTAAEPSARGSTLPGSARRRVETDRDASGSVGDEECSVSPDVTPRPLVAAAASSVSGTASGPLPASLITLTHRVVSALSQSAVTEKLTSPHPRPAERARTAGPFDSPRLIPTHPLGPTNALLSRLAQPYPSPCLPRRYGLAPASLHSAVDGCEDLRRARGQPSSQRVVPARGRDFPTSVGGTHTRSVRR